MKKEFQGRLPDKVKDESAAEAVAYQKPAFRCERVFETMALSCGKVGPTQEQCKFNRKSS